MHPLRCRFRKRSAFFALFDGHGGKSASDFCEKNFPSQLLNSFNKCKSVSTSLSLHYIFSTDCTNSTASTDFKSAERSMKKILIESYKSMILLTSKSYIKLIEKLITAANAKCI